MDKGQGRKERWLSTIEDECTFVPDVCFWRIGVSPTTDKDVAGENIASVDPFAS